MPPGTRFRGGRKSRSRRHCRRRRHSDPGSLVWNGFSECGWQGSSSPAISPAVSRYPGRAEVRGHCTASNTDVANATSAGTFGCDGNRCADACCCHDTCARSRIQHSRLGASSCCASSGAELRGSEWREVCHGCRGMPSTVKTCAVAGTRAAMRRATPVALIPSSARLYPTPSSMIRRSFWVSAMRV